MLKVDCQICKDPLGGKIQPAAMPCGHMYCIDCATFWFNSGENKKCFCGKAFSGDQIVRLWTLDDDQSLGSSSTGNRPGELAEACRADLANVDVNGAGGDVAIRSALQRVLDSVESLAPGSEDAGIKNVLRDVRQALQSIKEILERKLPKPAPPEQDVPAREDLRALQRTLRTITTQLASERAYTEVQTEGFRQQVARLSARTKELKKTCLEYQQRDRERRDRNRRLEQDNAALQSKLDASTKSAMKWRKKYYAVKQAGAQKNRPEGEDETLIVLD